MNGFSKDSVEISPVPGKTYKMFLVEVDDENRERVLSAQIVNVEIETTPYYDNIYTYYDNAPVKSCMTHQDVSVKAEIKPREDGTYFTIENFWEEENEQD